MTIERPPIPTDERKPAGLWHVWLTARIAVKVP